MQYRNGVPAGEIQDVMWFKSSRSSAQGGNCVEVAALPGGGAAMRHSRDPQGPALVYTAEEVDAFLVGVKAGEFDSLTG
ncbi:DUF397 domain-containing protein (plasmid) [Streptomyces dangxiongensis]|uniref:DUF397 domain-containing protein n=1 Tax=Streptomyces dangxiongensis TaxID=1442032 RepID=A0A3G2JAX1_9ACTN|nr:DUF397 domain-containing protein [Streptomyces dangxiongensis]AYN37682.1 DUF397 domain-containing protein [Streptomyces dangxiongensis]